MIARMWHGIVPKEKASAYREFLKETGIKDYASTDGNKAAFVLSREDEHVTHFYTLSFWDGIESIKKFAGEEPLKAKYYPEDEGYLLLFEPFVKHFDVLESHISF